MKHKKLLDIYSVLVAINLCAWIVGVFLAFKIPTIEYMILAFSTLLLSGGAIIFTMYLLIATIERINRIEEKLEKKEETEPPNDTENGKN